MEEQRFNHLVNALNEYEGVEEVFLLNSEGDIVFKSEDLNKCISFSPSLMQNRRVALLES